MKPESAPTTDIALSMTRTFDAPIEMVFEAWTTPEGLGAWFGPHDVTCEVDTMDVRVGGSWRAFLKSGDDTVYTAVGTYQEIEAPHLLRFTHGWEDENGEVPNFAHTTVRLEEMNGKTTMQFDQVGFPDQDECDRHEHGWTGSFEKLEDHAG